MNPKTESNGFIRILGQSSHLAYLRVRIGLHTMPYIAKSAWRPVVHLVGTGDVVLVVLARAGQTNSTTTLDLFLPTSGGRPSYGAVVERCDGPSRLATWWWRRWRSSK